MKEHQRVEWKESWRDEYLKRICGFANADGGVLVIGRNDKGTAVGVADARELLEDLPNKIRDVLGIMVDVNSWPTLSFGRAISRPGDAASRRSPASAGSMALRRRTMISPWRA